MLLCDFTKEFQSISPSVPSPDSKSDSSTGGFEPGGVKLVQSPLNWHARRHGCYRCPIRIQIGVGHDDGRQVWILSQDLVGPVDHLGRGENSSAMTIHRAAPPGIR